MSILLKLHLLFALVSISSLMFRLILKRVKPVILEKKIIKIFPHINDTCLLLAGVTLAVTYGVSPAANPWLISKLLGICVYIMLGVYALKIASTKIQQIFGGLAAISCFIWIASVAVTRSPLGFFTGIF